MESLSVVVFGVLGLAAITGTVSIFTIAILHGMKASARHNHTRIKVK